MGAEMIETTVFLSCVSAAAMMILVRLLYQLFRACDAKLRAEEYVVHTASGTRSRLNVYLRRYQELDNAAHHSLMGLDAEGTRAILEARRAVGRVDELLQEIERLIENSALERAAIRLTHLNGRKPRARISAPELYYPWEAELLRVLDRLSIHVMRAEGRLAHAA